MFKQSGAYWQKFKRSVPAPDDSKDLEVPPGLLELDGSGLIGHVNQSFLDGFGLSFSTDAFVGSPYRRLISSIPAPASAIVSSLIEIRLKGGKASFREDVMMPDGRVVSVQYIGVETDGKVTGHRWIFVDMTDARRNERSMHFRANLLAQVTDAVVTVDSNLSISFWNKGAEDLTGWKSKDAIGKSPNDIVKFRFHTPEAELSAWKLLTETGTWSGELIISSPYTTSERYVSTSATILKDDEGKYGGILAIVRDETERREMQDRLIHHAYHDLLTGLPNRMMLLRTLDGLTSRDADGRPFALLFMDLDRFKMVNDSMGHHAGDALLKKLADRLQDCVRDEDMVARLGGDEFAILLHDIEKLGGACEVADRIMEKMKDPFIIEALEIFSAASIGIVVGGEQYDLAEDILRDADAAMYQAKRAGRSCYEIFDRSQQMEATERFQLEGDLRRAVERGELRVYYQPVVDILEAKLEGFEALLRWSHPTRGLLAPHQFLSIAEESDLIVELDRWIWKTSIARLAYWSHSVKGGENLTVSLNCSNRTFNTIGLKSYIAGLLDEYGVDGSRIFLEVTEGVIIDDPGIAVDEMRALQDYGVRISIDDFGTGYASLSMLHQLPIDVLKIDRSFIKRMDRQDAGGEMLETIVDLGASLNLACVAEGIETNRQLESLQQMKCRFGQGYLFSKPLDAELTTALIEKREQWIAETFHRKAPMLNDRAHRE